MARSIPVQEISDCKLSLVDDIGTLFYWQGRIFRAITPESADFVRALFERGVIAALVSKGLFIESWISDLTLAGYPLLVEHKVVPVVTYPYEWSFSMLKDAALLVLRMNEVLRDYGLQTKDCHGFNILFDGGSPRYVDLGSITTLPPGVRSWRAEEEFVRYYGYALRMWASGDADFVRATLESEIRVMPHGAYLRHRHPILRWLPSGTLHRWARYYYKFKILGLRETQDMVRARVPGAAGRMILGLENRKLLPLQTFHFRSWQRKLERLSPPDARSAWADYQCEYLDEQGNLRPTPRHGRVVEILKDLGVQSLVEFGANQGVFSRLALNELRLNRIVSADYDENAIDLLYARIRNTDQPITPAVLDCIFPTVTRRTADPAERFRCDAVVALAISHHLVLTQRISLDHVLEVLGEFAARYMLIEFMPLGLWDGSGTLPTPPWYTLEWFSNTFQKHYKLLLQETLETNRIIFVGEKQNRAPDA